MYDIDNIRSSLKILSDEALIKEFLKGPDAFQTQEIWRIIEEEIISRGETVIELRNEALQRKKACDQIDAQRARWQLRLGAIVLDFIVISILSLLVQSLVIILILYHPFCDFIFRKTVGRAILKMDLVMQDGSPPSAKALAIRAITRPLVGGLIWWSVYGTPWIHDYASRTAIVLKKNEETISS